MIILSVVICTYNRASILADTLASYGKLEEAIDEKIELIVVDNNSSDETSKITFKAGSTISGLRYIHEPRQGLSHARNRGIRESRGNIIAFADDDVFFDRNWAYSIIDAFERVPEAGAIGGKSTPLFDGVSPEWMRESFLNFYGDTRFGDKERWIEFPAHPYGLNMAFRSKTLEQIGEFNPMLGRNKSSLLSSEETDLFERIHNNGLRTLYVPQAHLFHRIPQERATLQWIASRYYWQGVSDAARMYYGSKQSSIDMLAHSFKSALKMSGILFNRGFSPRKLFWHVRSPSVRMHLKYLYGKSLESLRLAFRSTN